MDKQARQFIGQIRRFNCDCGKWIIMPPSIHHDDPLQYECGAMYWIDNDNIQHCHAPRTQLMIVQEQLNLANKEIEELKRQLHAERTDDDIWEAVGKLYDAFYAPRGNYTQELEELLDVWNRMLG